jgi:hypothetical protein
MGELVTFSESARSPSSSEGGSVDEEALECVAELQAKRRELNRTMDDVRRQLDETRVGAQKQAFRVEVLATCPQGKSAQLSLSYLVGGASWTPAYEAGATFSLTFGIDDSVRVKRTVNEELKKDSGVFNSRMRFTYAYTFDLANYGKAPIEVSVSDHLPVAEVNDIEVALTEKTTAGAQVNKASGVATWKVALKPQEKKSVVFGFRVDVPTSYDMGGL